MSATPDLFPGFAERRITTDSRRRDLPAHGRLGAAACCCCTAIRRPTSPGTRSRPSWRGTAPWSLPTCAATAQARHRPAMRSTSPTPSARWRRTACAVMRALGHERFMVAGHDRGGRVAYRLALDHPDAVSALIPIDIFPTAEVWRRTSAESMLKSYHWAFLAQPHPMPETLIAKDPVFYLEYTLKSWAKPRDLSPFAPEALAHYRALAERACTHSRRLRRLSRRRHDRSAARRRRSCRRPQDRLPDIRPLGPTAIFPATRSTSGAPGART